MIVGVTMDVFAAMVECTLVMIVTIQVSHSDVSFGHAPHKRKTFCLGGDFYSVYEKDYCLNIILN